MDNERDERVVETCWVPLSATAEALLPWTTGAAVKLGGHTVGEVVEVLEENTAANMARVRIEFYGPAVTVAV